MLIIKTKLITPLNYVPFLYHMTTVIFQFDSLTNKVTFKNVNLFVTILIVCKTIYLPQNMQSKYLPSEIGPLNRILFKYDTFSETTITPK